MPPKNPLVHSVAVRYLGAAKFHRALNHFNALRVWGDVPPMMAPVTDFAGANSVVRAPIADVYAQIVADPVSKIGWKATNIWAAIPQHEIDINPAIKQNPGY